MIRATRRILIMTVFLSSLAAAGDVGVSRFGDWSQQSNFQSDLKLRWNGGLVNRYDKVYRRSENGPLLLTDHFQIKAKLGLMADPDPDVRIALSLEMTKYWNAWWIQKQPSPETGFLSTETQTPTATAAFERAYVRYKTLGEQIQIYLGRLPTDENQRFYSVPDDDTSGLPILSYGKVMDGFLIVATPALLDDSRRVRLLAGYSPYLLINYEYRKSPIHFKPSTNGGQGEVENLSPMGTLGADFKSDQTPIGQLRAGFYHRWVNYQRVPDSTLDSKVLNPIWTGSSTVQSNLAVYSKFYSSFVEWDQIFNLPYSLAINLLSSSIRSQGRLYVSSGTGAGQSFGFGTSSEDATLDGTMTIVTILAKPGFLNLGDLKPSVGVQYLSASRDLFYEEGRPESPVGLYETRGEAWHLFLSQDLARSLNIGMGFVRQRQYWGPWGFGLIRDEAYTIETIYGRVAAHF